MKGGEEAVRHTPHALAGRKFMQALHTLQLRQSPRGFHQHCVWLHRCLFYGMCASKAQLFLAGPAHQGKGRPQSQRNALAQLSTARGTKHHCSTPAAHQGEGWAQPQRHAAFRVCDLNRHEAFVTHTRREAAGGGGEAVASLMRSVCWGM